MGDGEPGEIHAREVGRVVGGTSQSRKEVGAQMPTLNPNFGADDRVHESMFCHQYQ